MTPAGCAPATTSRMLPGWSCVVLLALSAVTTGAELLPCRQGGTDPLQVVRALDRIRRSIDPCGESAELVAALERVERCATARYEICTTAEARRNLFERP